MEGEITLKPPKASFKMTELETFLVALALGFGISLGVIVA